MSARERGLFEVVIFFRNFSIISVVRLSSPTCRELDGSVQFSLALLQRLQVFLLEILNSNSCDLPIHPVPVTDSACVCLLRAFSSE